MLKELRKYRNFGTPNYFFELFWTFRKNKEVKYTKTDIEKLFYNRVIDGRSVFDGCIEIALNSEMLVFENDFLSISNRAEDSLNSISQMKDKFVELLFVALKEDDEFHKIFCSEFLSYDVIYKSLQINNQAFGLKYSNFKQLLIDFDVIKTHPTPELNSFIINNRFKKLFDKTVLSEIKRRKIGIEEFRQSVEQKQIYGEEAEKFVLNFEFARLNELKEIIWVAEYIVNEGYDIASYNNESDELPNRFIEVKSYDGEKPYFYWSNNEMMVAKYRQDTYWLYLVNRTELNKTNYEPIQVQNPYKYLFESDLWLREAQSWKFSLL